MSTFFLFFLFFFPSSTTATNTNDCIWCFSKPDGYCTTKGGYTSGYGTCTCAGTCSCSGICGNPGEVQLSLNMMELNANDHLDLPINGVLLNLSISDLAFLYEFGTIGTINSKLDNYSVMLDHIGLYKLEDNLYVAFRLINNHFDITDCSGAIVAKVY